jgi:hypothetical protein
MSRSVSAVKTAAAQADSIGRDGERASFISRPSLIISACLELEPHPDRNKER